MDPLTGDAFVIDLAKVHTLIINFISGNKMAKSKVHTRNNVKFNVLGTVD